MSPQGRPARVGAALLTVVLSPALACCSRPTPVPFASDIGAVPRHVVQEGGTLRWAVDAVPATLNAYQVDATAETARVTGAVLPALFTLDERGRPRPNHDYLRGVELRTGGPRQVVVYRLDPRARWTSGRRISAEDFAAQWRALSGMHSGYRPARNDGYQQIRKVEQGESPQEVEVTFDRPYADWRSLFTPLYPRSVTASPRAFNGESRDHLEETAGPFRVREIDRTGDRRAVTLARNGRWWGKPAKLDRLVLVQVERDRRVAALRRNEVDLAELEPVTATAAAPATSARPARSAPGDPGPGATGGSVAAGRVDPVAGAAALPGVTVRRSTGAASTQLTLNGQAGPLADERVRRAVARAIDRRAIADSVLRPLRLPVRTLDNHLFLPHQDGYQDNSAVLGGHSREHAMALLNASGWRTAPAGTRQTRAPAAGPPRRGVPDGRPRHTPHSGRVAGGDAPAESGLRHPVTVVEPAAVRTKQGRPLTLRLLLPDGASLLGGVADQIARMLSRVGVRTEITQVASDEFVPLHLATGAFDLALFSWPGTAYPATDARSIYAKPLPAADGSLVIEQNYARVGTDEIDQLFEHAVTELDAKEARGLAVRTDARIWAAAHSVPLYQRPELVAVRGTVANAGAFGLVTPRYQDIGFRAADEERAARGKGS
ncbi:ABC transporter family substrate-binding protein [Wenjunlia vitaminophila]|uniref:ABC transporter family substrate-binding protein n=1 Tax=Wenjunlia vitaminophila TaxID=76728 RepID=UPI0003808BD0|nr:ABC transporter family substrate-binding protein [Wenjunlia vitaminophila]